MLKQDKTYIKIIKTGPLASFLFLCALLSTLLTGCSQPSEQLVYSGTTMGTSYLVKVIPGDVKPVADLGEKIDSRLQQLNQIFTTYQEDSELMALNRVAVGQPVQVSDDMRQVLAIAHEVFTLSSGAFDPTVGPLVNLWGFGPGLIDNVIPPAERIEQQRKLMGFQHLSFNRDAATLVRDQDIQLDLSAVAKGYAVDALAVLLEGLGYTSYLVEVGGELRASGVKTYGDPWRIAIEKPGLVQGGVQQAISLDNVAIATSGDYRNYFEKDGKRYSHTIDPRTGYPVEHPLASVTVIEPSAAKADAMATAMMVMGPEQALSLAEQQDIPVYLLVKQGDGFEVKYSTSFAPYLSGE